MSQLKVWRGVNCVITVQPSVLSQDITAVGVPKLKIIEPQLPDGDYYLLYSNGMLADTVPPNNEPFTSERYKAFIGKSYQKLTLYVCPVGDYNSGCMCTYTTEAYCLLVGTNGLTH